MALGIGFQGAGAGVGGAATCLVAQEKGRYNGGLLASGNGKQAMKNTLYFGDNLEVLQRHVEDDSVDLIYLDPPFNSKTDYNILFKEQ